MSETKTLPKIQDLYSDVGLAQANDTLTALLNQPPKKEWIKIHPYIAGYKYLPIDKVEFLLKKIFKKYRIEILREGIAFNGVYVVVRVWYLNPITNEFDYHDGIGAKELQVKKGASAADLAMINSGALAMAFPIAKTVAIKDACDHFGSLFGSDLNRKDVMSLGQDEVLQKKTDPISKFNQKIVENKEFVSHEEVSVTRTEIANLTVVEPEIIKATPAQAFDIPPPAPTVITAPPPAPEFDDDF